MKRVVMLTEREWAQLPVNLGIALAAALAARGVKLVDVAAGKQVDRVPEFLIGELAIAIPDSVGDSGD